MNGRYLLDTNIIIALFDEQASVIASLAQAEETFVPSIALGELKLWGTKIGTTSAKLGEDYSLYCRQQNS